jgi:hypothetical protein
VCFSVPSFLLLKERRAPGCWKEKLLLRETLSFGSSSLGRKTEIGERERKSTKHPLEKTRMPLLC